MVGLLLVNKLLSILFFTSKENSKGQRFELPALSLVELVLELNPERRQYTVALWTHYIAMETYQCRRRAWRNADSPSNTRRIPMLSPAEIDSF